MYKMTVYYFSKAGNSERMAQAIAKIHKTKSDHIPPAYPCESQKLVLIGLELKGGVDSSVRNFCMSLNPNRTKNVAFFVTSEGSTDGLNDLKDVLKRNGVNVLSDVYNCTLKGGLFKAPKVSDADVTDVVAWSNKVVESLM